MHVEYNASLRMNNDHKSIPTRLCLIIDYQGEKFLWWFFFSERERERERERKRVSEPKVTPRVEY